jgi:hypothetical protein
MAQQLSKPNAFAFVKYNSDAVCTNTEIVSGANDDPELWTELVQAVAPSGPKTCRYCHQVQPTTAQVRKYHWCGKYVSF